MRGNARAPRARALLCAGSDPGLQGNRAPDTLPTMMPAALTALGRAPTVLLLVLLAACREGEADPLPFEALPLAEEGAHGCNGLVQAVQLTVLGTFPWIGPTSQMVADETDEMLFVTGGDGSVRRLEVGPGPITETVLVSPFVIDSILAFAGVSSPAQLSGIAMLDENNLLVAENTSNTILIVSRIATNAVFIYAGDPDEMGDFEDGTGGDIRFDFSDVAQIIPVGEDEDSSFSEAIFVTDPGNHRVRLLQAGLLPIVSTVAGNGTPAFHDGDLEKIRFDTPTGITLTCDGELLVSERGGAGTGGNRLRLLRLGVTDVLFGRASTLAGDGTSATVQGVGTAASLAGPVAPVTTMSGEIYWMDSMTGILRRWSPATGEVDCPLFPDCASAGGGFTAGGNFALTIGPSDTLYVLDAAAQTLSAITL